MLPNLKIYYIRKRLLTNQFLFSTNFSANNELSLMHFKIVDRPSQIGNFLDKVTTLLLNSSIKLSYIQMRVNCVALGYSIVLYCVALYCIILYCNVLYCKVSGVVSTFIWVSSPRIPSLLFSSRPSLFQRAIASLIYQYTTSMNHALRGLERVLG